MGSRGDTSPTILWSVRAVVGKPEPDESLIERILGSSCRMVVARYTLSTSIRGRPRVCGATSIHSGNLSKCVRGGGFIRRSVLFWYYGERCGEEFDGSKLGHQAGTVASDVPILW